MTNSDKTIVVFGVTGNQGGSVARALLKDGWSVAGITRIPSSKASKDLAALGVTLHQGDLDDPASYAPALEGAYGAFLTLDYWAHYDGTNATHAQAREEEQGFGAVKVLAAANLHHVVYSTLETVQPKMALPHFDSKAAIAARLREAGVPTTLLYTSYYYSNVLGQIAEEKDGSLRINNPLPDGVVLPSFAVEDTGLWTAKAFADTTWIGKDMYAAGQNMTVAEVAQGIAKVTGRKVHTNAVTEEQFKNDTKTDREWYRNCVAFHRGLIVRDVKASRQIAPDAMDFDAWAKQNEGILKYRK